jgi:hypothetical protein
MASSGEVRTGVRFNVREFARTAHGNFRASLELAEFAGKPLDGDSLQIVRYLARLESATMEHLRNLLVTATHKDARVTAFLVTWAFEKFWIADALDAVLEANGSPRSRDVDEGHRRRTLAEAGERRGPIRRAISAIRQGVPIIAVHMTTGLIDEWIMRVAYEQLAAASGSPALTGAIGTILDIKRRHAEFFDDESRRRLAESPRAVVLTRKALSQAVWPIGAIDRAGKDRTFFDTFVFAGKDGAARASSISARVAALPGIDVHTAALVGQRLLP